MIVSGGLVLLLAFLFFILVRVPIAISLAASALLSLTFSIDFHTASTTIAHRMAGGLNNFTLLAIPLFILSGFLMGQGGIAYRLIEFAKVLVGRFPAGLALVNIIACALFGSVSGSAVAATSAIGGIMIPVMEKEGYDKNFSTALTMAGSTSGLIIPPSNILIIYSLSSGVSVAALFVAGYIPGLLLSLILMLACILLEKKYFTPNLVAPQNTDRLKKLLQGLPALFLIVIVIGGIIAGIFTATEASAIAVLYSAFLSLFVYKEIKLAQLPQILLKAGETSAIVLFLIGASCAMSWVLTYANIPQEISNALLSISDNPIYILLSTNLILLLVGTFMDMTPAVLIFTPIFLPVVTALGISELHFGIMMVLNLCIGLCTPPVGSVLFVGCGIAKTSIKKVIPPLLPMYLAMLITLCLIAVFPALSSWLPNALGLI